MLTDADIEQADPCTPDCHPSDLTKHEQTCPLYRVVEAGGRAAARVMRDEEATVFWLSVLTFKDSFSAALPPSYTAEVPVWEDAYDVVVGLFRRGLLMEDVEESFVSTARALQRSLPAHKFWHYFSTCLRRRVDDRATQG